MLKNQTKQAFDTLQKEIDYKYSLNLLERINNVKVEDNKIASLFVVDEYDFWQSNQQNVFSQIKLFSKDKDYYKKNLKSNFIKSFLISLFGILYSIISLILIKIQGKKVLIFSPDKVSGKYKNDKRIEKIYDFLKSNNIKYYESLHTLLGREFIKNIFLRLRPAFYPQSFDLFIFLFSKKKETIKLDYLDSNIFNKDEIKFVSYLISQSFFSKKIFKFRISLFKFVLRHTNTKKVLMIDDVRSWGSVVVASKELGVKSYAFQHGHFTKYHVGWIKNTNIDALIPKPDFLVVWSNYWKDGLIRLGTYFDKEEILIAAKDEAEFYDGNKLQNKEIGILIPYETDAPKEEVLSFIKKTKNCNNVKIYFKVRPDIDNNVQLEEYKIIKEEVEIIRDIKKDFEKISLAVGTYSTFLYDIMIYKIPVAILDSSLDYGYGMVANKLADFISLNDDDFCGKVLKLSETSDEILEGRYNRYSQSDQTIAEFLKKVFK